MSSAFTWLDFAESDRQQAMQVIDLFREKSTVDELGFGPIRDAFADHFFPGTSTIQTRARYFLFVPWIARRYERRKLSAQEISQKVRGRETRLIKALLAGDEDQGGIIGREALGKLKRMPSAVYWRGLNLWGVRLFSGSMEQYCRQNSKGRMALRGGVVTDDGEPLDRIPINWHPDLPSEPEDLYERATFALTEKEAEFLKERICSAQPMSLLAQLVTRATRELDAPYELRVWQGQIAQEASTLSAWDRVAFWKLVNQINPRLSRRTQDFAEQWITIAQRAGAGTAVWEEPSVQKLVAHREGQLKGGRARLRPENLRARDRWQGDVDGGPMDFRWGPTRTILNDILDGLPPLRARFPPHATRSSSVLVPPSHLWSTPSLPDGQELVRSMSGGTGRLRS